MTFWYVKGFLEVRSASLPFLSRPNGARGPQTVAGDMQTRASLLPQHELRASCA